MAGQIERTVVRMLVGAALCVTLLVSAFLPIPVDTAGDPVLPAVAFGQASLYRLEIALLIFYAILLLATPAFSGLVRGRLPIEISVRGARFEEKADRSVEQVEAEIEALKQRTKNLADRLTMATIEIDRLEKGRVTRGD
jgi:hypothetical protein